MSVHASLGQAEAYARELFDAEGAARPVAPLSERCAGLDVSAAYAIQKAGMTLRIASGARIVGRKIGLTNQAIQRQLGVDSPDYGYLLDTMVIDDGAELSLGDFIAPRLEPEIAFVLGTPLRGPNVTIADVLRATSGVRAAIEVIDSRIRDWKIALVDTVADNASSSRVVLGNTVVPVHEIDLVRESVRIESTAGADASATVRGSGTGAAVLGHPAAAIAWLANALATYGDGLAAGDVVIPGAMCAAIWAEPETAYAANFSTIGSVRVRFRP